MQYGNIINIIEASTLHVTHGNVPVLNILSLTVCCMMKRAINFNVIILGIGGN